MVIFRLDFERFSITGPEPVNHQCDNDQFIVSGSNPVPVICGFNTGSHSTYYFITISMFSIFRSIFRFIRVKTVIVIRLCASSNNEKLNQNCV